MRPTARGARSGKAIALAALVLGLASGCASTCPRFDDRSWHEVVTRNFRLRGDLDEGKARAAVTELEAVRAALLSSFGASAEIDTGQIKVVALDEGWHAAAGPRISGLFAPALGSSYILFPAREGLARQDGVKYGLAQHLNHVVHPQQPAWLAEGLAVYFQSLQLAPDRRQFSVGRPDPEVVTALQLGWLLPLTELRVQPPRNPGAFTATAWLTVHYLMNRRRAGLRSYLAPLTRGEDDAAAFRAAFGELSLQQLGAELTGYLNGGRYEVLVYPFAPPPVVVTAARRTPPADAHAARALFYALMSKTAERESERMSRNAGELAMCARQEIDQALADDGQHAEALAIRASLAETPP